MLPQLALISIDLVKDWITQNGWWPGAFISFGLLFSCGLGFPMPEDIPLIITGAFLCQDVEGTMPLWQKWAIVGSLNWAGIIGGDVCLYWLSRRYGMNVTRLPLIGKHVTEERIKHVQGLFDHYGIWVVAIGRLLAGIRGAMVITAGITRYNFLKFIIADSIAAVISGGMFMLLGHWLGTKLNDQTIKEFKHYFLGGAVVLIVLLVAYIWWRKKSHKGVSDVIADKVR